MTSRLSHPHLPGILWLRLTLLFLTFLTFKTSKSSAAPTMQSSRSSEFKTRDDSSGVSGPVFLTYYDDYNGNPVPEADNLKGFNVLALGFYTSHNGPMDSAQWWEQQGASKQNEIRKTYNDAGIKLIVSVFGGGAGETSVTSQISDPEGLAEKIGTWVKANNLDGVDVDYEDFGALNDGRAVPWLVSFQTALRAALPSPQYIISHTPTAWLFVGGTGPYIDVHKQVGDGIDWYNIQFYNDGDEYTTCDNLLNKSSQFPKTSLFEIIQSGIPSNKVVLGKPATKQDAQQGNMDADILAGCLETAKGQGWSGGVMGWAYPNANSSWISSVRSKSWPVS